LQRRQIAANRAGRDGEFVGKAVNRSAMALRLMGVMQLPLAFDFLFPGHTAA
jgi:hypothetical protein